MPRKLSKTMNRGPKKYPSVKILSIPGQPSTAQCTRAELPGFCVELEVRDDLSVSSVRVEATDPGRVVSSTVLRKIGLDELRVVAVQDFWHARRASVAALSKAFEGAHGTRGESVWKRLSTSMGVQPELPKEP